METALDVYPEMKSIIVGTFSMGLRTTSSSSTKQKVNSISSMEAELFSVGNKMSKVMWSKRFAEAQGFKVNLIILFFRQHEHNYVNRKRKIMFRKDDSSFQNPSVSCGGFNYPKGSKN